MSSAERARDLGYFDDGGLPSMVASPVSSNSMRPDMSATTANNLMADLGLGGQSYGGDGTLYADASKVTRPGVASDAGGAFTVEVGGVDWLRSKTIPPLAGGTPVQESTDPKNSQLMVELPTGGAAPSIEGYQLQGTKSYSSVGTTSYFYAPGTPADAGGDDFVGPPSPDIAEGAASQTLGQFLRTDPLPPYTPNWQADIVRNTLRDAIAQQAQRNERVVGPIDYAGNARAALAQQRVVNNLAGSMGGPFVAGPMQMARMAGLNENQVQEAGVLGLAVQDAFGTKGSGSMSAMARSPKGPTIMMDYLGGMSRSDRMAAGLRLESVQGTLDTYSMYGGNYATQVYMRAFDGNGKLLPGRVRLDGVGRRFDGGYDLIDNKLSGNAPFTKNQERHYPAFARNGGVVTGYRGIDISLPKGTVLPPTPVEVLRGPLPVYRQPN